MTELRTKPHWEYTKPFFYPGGCWSCRIFTQDTDGEPGSWGMVMGTTESECLRRAETAVAMFNRPARQDELEGEA